MKVLVQISKEEFDSIHADYTARNQTDYYTAGEGKYISGKDIATENLFWPICCVANKKSYSEDVYYIRPGFTINERGVMYRTSAGNTAGVFKNNNGKYYGFYSGRRSRVNDVPFGTGARVVEYSTDGAADMYWYETEASYCIRKGYEYSLGRLAANLYAYGENQKDIYVHWVRQGKDVERDLSEYALRGQDPETFLLKTFSGKKIPLDNLDGIYLAAWNMLPTETQERIAKWN